MFQNDKLNRNIIDRRWLLPECGQGRRNRGGGEFEGCMGGMYGVEIYKIVFLGGSGLDTSATECIV